MMPSSLAFGPKPDDVAGRHDVPLIGGQRFEQPPRGALKHRARFVAHDAEQALHAQHAAQAADVAVDVGQHMRAGVVLDDLGAGDGSLARDVALAADALAVRRVDGRVGAGQLAAESLVAGADLAVLAKVGANLALLFGH